MEGQKTVKELFKCIKSLVVNHKKVLNVEDLSYYTGLSKSKIYKLTQLNQIPTGNNPYIRQKFFEKEAIDDWLLGRNRTSYPGDHRDRQRFNPKDQD